MTGKTFFVFLIIRSLVVATTSQPVVTVQQGAIKGTTHIFIEDEFTGAGGTKVDVFKGIPFAEPPLGELRFKPPVEKTEWSGIYVATYFRPACLQDRNVGLSLVINEDCLYLNVFAPNQRMVSRSWRILAT
ncbi:carboxylesterase 4A-like [Patiria miniata]|uniref:Carboxylesterase type B domain-containing protein n=1 Tax=Patiria miniata TaxID=46514 RepID=A0A913Z9K7_PATMI|nr:carboxylesterase 4A-like [Patiria miniata]